MSEVESRRRFPARNPACLSSSATGISGDRKPRRRRRIRSPAFPGCGRRSGPSTPFLRWKFEEAELLGGEPPLEPADETLQKYRKAAGDERPAASARRIAAGIWNLRLPEPGGGGKTSLGLESNHGQLHLSYLSNGNCINLQPDGKDEFSSLISIKSHRNGISHKIDSSASLLHSSIERATKWDPRCSNVSKDAYELYGNLKLLEDKQACSISIVSALRSELELARSRVSELEDEQLSAKKKLDRFVRKFEDEKAAWKRREHEKIRSVIDAIKEDLNIERKNRHRLQIMNTKLVNELTEAKLSAKQFLQEYEKERKTRELMEEVCNELAKEIGDDKAEVEVLKIESMKNKEEVEEERKMLQMAEVWREERVQMKLTDAKLMLEEKYSQLSKLYEEIEAFLRSRSGDSFDASQMKQVEALKEAVRSVKTHEMKEFSYQPPPASQDIFSICEELQSREQANENGIKQCYESVTPEANGLSKKHMSLLFDGNGDAEDDSGWETVSHVDEQGSSKSRDASEPSVNGVYLESQASVSGTDWDEHGEDEIQNSEISEVCSLTKKQSRKKGSSICRLWKSSRASNAKDFEKISFELTNGRLCDGRPSTDTLSPARNSAETGLSSPSVGNWSSPDLLNPRITLGMKGHANWPRGTKKQSLKAKLMEARIQSQKVQLRQVLKQKI